MWILLRNLKTEIYEIYPEQFRMLFTIHALSPSGNAVRHCNIEKGWLPPELFNCTTNTFVDLKIMVSCVFLWLVLQSLISLSGPSSVCI